MGIFDFVAKVQEKINDIQKKIETTSLESILAKKKEKPRNVAPSPRKAAKAEKPIQSMEGVSAQIIAQRDSLKRNGFKEYEFIANRTCCEICGKLNGKHFLLTEFQIGVNAPPMHDGCRCSIAAYEDEEEYEQWLNSL